jgi:hypothetical protein
MLGIAELLIYGFPIFAGIIGSKYLSRLGNFVLMAVVFELDLGLLLGQFGHFRLLALTPYTVLCIIPALAGIVGYKYFRLGDAVNTLLIIAIFWIGGVLLAYQSRGQFMPVSFLTAVSVSAGFLIPPLVFILVAIVAHPLRRFATP